MGGGAENCLGAADTGAPWATGEAEADGETDGFGRGLSEPETCAADGGVAAGLGGAVVGAGGAAD
jgi:hypothetical protein